MSDTDTRNAFQSDSPAVDKDTPHTSTPNLSDIEKEIASLREQVSKIPEGIVIPSENRAFPPANTTKIKNDLTAVLDNISATLPRIRGVFGKLDDIKGLLIDPVRDEIKRAGDLSIGEIHRSIDEIHIESERSKTWDRLNLVAAVLSFFLGLFLAPIVARYVLGDRQPKAPLLKETQSQVGSPSESAGVPTLNDIANVVVGTPDRRPFGEDLETLQTLVKTKPVDTGKLKDVEESLIQALRKGGPNASAEGVAATYGLMVCEALFGRWNKVTKLADKWGAKNPTDEQLKNLRNQGYGFAVRVYAAEASRYNGTLDDAISEYGKLKAPRESLSASDFLSPTSFVPTDRSFVENRVAELTAWKELIGRHIWVYDMGDGRLGAELTQLLVQDHLDEVRAPGKWGHRFTASKVCIFYKKGPSDQVPKPEWVTQLTKLVSLKLPTLRIRSKLEVPLEYSSYNRTAVNQEFGQKPGPDVLILLPRGAKETASQSN